jgi:hypothetical protein
MNYLKVVIVNLKTIGDCDNMISSIENDPDNICGGFRAWNSGHQTFLLSGAEKKIEAIQRKCAKLGSKHFKSKYKEYKNKCGKSAVSFEEYEEKEMYC